MKFRVNNGRLVSTSQYKDWRLGLCWHDSSVSTEVVKISRKRKLRP